MPKSTAKSAPAKGQQPEALATFAAASMAGGVKPDKVGLTATRDTAPMPNNLKKSQDAAEKVLNEGATGRKQGAERAVKAQPDRTHTTQR